MANSCSKADALRVHYSPPGWRWRYLPGFLIQSIRAARQAKRAPEASPFQSFATPIALSGPAPCGVTRRRCAPLCDQACIAASWRGSRSGAMRTPWSIGFRMPRNHHPGRRHIGACKRGPAFEGQSPIGGPAPVRDPRAADERRSGIQVIAGAESLYLPRAFRGAQGKQTTMSPLSGQVPPVRQRSQRHEG